MNAREVITHKQKNISGCPETYDIGELNARMKALERDIQTAKNLGSSPQEITEMMGRHEELYTRWARLRFGS